MEQPISFGIVGGAGFRAQAFLRVAEALPERFRVTGLVVRDAEKGEAMERRWQLPSYRTLEALLERETPDFVLISASKGAGAEYLVRLAETGLPALLETPPAEDLPALLALHERLAGTGAKVQVAEQYHLQPMHAARGALIASGRLGRVTEATVSISHLYHAASLIRRMLGIGYEEAQIRAMRFTSTLVAGPNRQGPPLREELVAAPRELAWLDFGDRLGIYDFAKDQHRSWIRSNHVSVRGERGELFDRRVSYLADFRTPIELELRRVNKGENENLEGYFLQGILAGDQWVYRNLYAPARLNDDELALAECLTRMAAYVRGGADFYSLAEASQDQYLGLMIEEAVRTGQPVFTSRQPWAPPAGKGE